MEVQKLLERTKHMVIRLSRRGNSDKQVYGWDYEEDFFVPEEVTAHFNELKQKGIEKENEWNEQFNVYRESNPCTSR